MSSYLRINTGDNTYISFADSGFTGVGTGSASFAVWVKMANKNVSNVLFQKYDGSNGYQAKFNAEVNGDLSLDFLVDGDELKTTTINNVPVKLDEWQLYVFVIDKAGTLKIYIDAVIHADTNNISTPSGNIDNSDNFYIGFDSTNPSSSSSGSFGIDSFSFYSDVLDEIDIAYLYNKGRGRKIDGTETNIVFGLNLDEGTGVSVIDTVGSLTGTISTSESSSIWSETGGVAVLEPSDLKLYLTSLEPDLSQANYSQSLGGYISTSLIYPETTLANTAGIYQSNLTLDDYTDLTGYEYIAMRSEVAKVTAISSNNITSTERGVNNIVGYYPIGTIVQGVTSLFNDSFNLDRKQYRCYVLKNTSSTETAYRVSAYFRQLSQNAKTTMRVALEYPKSQEVTGVTSSWTSSMLVDSSIAGLYADNFFADSYITFVDSPNAGQKSRINSYDGETGTFVLSDSLAVDFNEDNHSNLINYIVDASPSQRIKTGVDAPLDNEYISSFSTATSRANAVELTTLDSVGEMAPGDIIYVWIEREIGKASSTYDNNSFVLTIDFEKELEEF